MPEWSAPFLAFCLLICVLMHKHFMDKKDRRIADLFKLLDYHVSAVKMATEQMNEQTRIMREQSLTLELQGDVITKLKEALDARQ